MKIRGWVYVISNEAMPGLIKIGFSTKDPHLRAPELNSTGMPLSYDVLYDALTIEPRTVEQRAHALLQSQRVGKEWFRADPWVAVNAIREAAGKDLLSENLHKIGEPSVQQAPQTTERPMCPSPLVRLECVFCGTPYQRYKPLPHQMKCGKCGEWFDIRG